VVVFMALVVFVFFLLRLVPGDPALNILGQDATPQGLAAVRHDLGLDQSIPHQFASYIGKLAHGNLGKDFISGVPVTDIIRQRFSTTMELAGAGLLIVLALSIPFGLLAGAMTREGRHPKLELGFMSFTSVFGSIPELLSGTVLAAVFGVYLRWLPVGGQGSFQHLILPAIAVSLAPLMTLSRVVRVQTLDVLAQDYIRTARSKRVPGPRLFFRHVLPNVLTAILTVAGLLFAGLIAGTVIVENIFARQGLGTALVNGVISRNYAIVQAITLLLGVVVVVVNALVDAILAIVDPRSLARYA
jgi:peptide/nickel transport system permease protein